MPFAQDKIFHVVVANELKSSRTYLAQRITLDAASARKAAILSLSCAGILRELAVK